MAEYLIQEETLTGIADKIRVLSGAEDVMTPAVMEDNLDIAIAKMNSALFLEGGSQTATLHGTATDWRSLAYGNGMFVAIACDTDVVVYSEDGIVWTEATMPSSSSWVSVTYGNGRFVAITQWNVAAYSDDGINWTETSFPSSGTWNCVAYGNSRFLAIDQDYCSVAISIDDGVTWSETGASVGGVYEVYFCNGWFVALDSSNAYCSYDGYEWFEYSISQSGSWYNSGIAYGNGVYVSPTENSDTVIYSTDAQSWNTASLPVSAAWSHIVFGGEKFVAIANNSNVAIYSEDGINWTQTTLPNTINWSKVVYGNDKFVAVASNSTTAAISDDGISWHDGATGGALLNNSDVDVTEDALLTIGSTVEQAVPNITVNSSTGLITATSEQEFGIVEAGTQTNTLQLSIQNSTTITPTTSNQTAISAGTYVTGAVTVAGDADLIADNIVAGKEIFGVTGTSWAGTLSFSGNYATSTYYTAAGSFLSVDKDTGRAFITIQGGTSESYENIYFAATSLPSGVQLLAPPSNYNFGTDGSAQYYFTAVLTGVTGKINVAVAMGTRSGSYDAVQCALTVTYA